MRGLQRRRSRDRALIGQRVIGQLFDELVERHIAARAVLATRLRHGLQAEQTSARLHNEL